MSDEELEQDGGHGFEDMQFIDADGNRIDLSQLSPEQIMELQQLSYPIGHQQDDDEEGEEYDDEEQQEDGDYYQDQEQDQHQSHNPMQDSSHAPPPIMSGSSEYFSPNRRDTSPSPKRRDSSPGGDPFDIDETFRKVKRDLLENLNRQRRERKLSPFYLEIMPIVVAERYASFLLDTDHDQNDLEFYKYVEKGLGDCNLVHITAKFEEDVNVTPQVMYNYFMEMGYLFLEVEADRRILLNPDLNHISIGVNSDDSQIVIVFIVSRRDLCITRIIDLDANTVQVEGKMLDDQVGVYALQILPFQDQGKPPDKNENNKIGPEFISFDKITRQFIAKIPNQGGGCSPDIRQYIDLYTRNTPESIPYTKQTRDKLNLKHLELKLRIPVKIFPDPHYMLEEAIQNTQIEPQQVPMDQPEHSEQQNGSQKDEMGGSEEDEPQSEQELHVPKTFQVSKEPQISNKDIREELDIAIAEAQRQHDELYDHNVSLQQKIKQIRNKQEVYADKNNEMTMNEHKYLNTLAHVHQIRLDLQQTQDRYNEMAQDLQRKLDEKSKKCNEIRQAFMELKREVARKATYSRTDKPIPEQKILDWEELEMQKNRVLQELRLDTLRLKNTLAKNQKQLKKKEELAEGLHLIDFEQLKIENQTLNEKIEERTEDLHKLKNKNTRTVQMLTHTREKLGFVKAKFQKYQEENGKKKKELDFLRDELGKEKGKKDGLRNDNLKLKQQTGIANRQELIQDYKRRKDRIEELKVELKQQEEHLRSMQQVIDRFAQQLQIKQQQQSNKQKVKLF